MVTSGMLWLDGKDVSIDNNVWLVGDDAEVLVIDAAHDAAAIVSGVAGRRVVAIACTHAHNDHVNVAVDLAEELGAPVWLHPEDRMLWDMTHPDRGPDADLEDGQRINAGGVELEVRHTPGHTPGGCCLLVGDEGTLFSGDTLFRGGPGATGRRFSDFDTIIDSIRARLLDLPGATVVHTGHGDDTTIGEESSHLQDWIARGY